MVDLIDGYQYMQKNRQATQTFDWNDLCNVILAHFLCLKLISGTMIAIIIYTKYFKSIVLILHLMWYFVFWLIVKICVGQCETPNYVLPRPIELAYLGLRCVKLSCDYLSSVWGIMTLFLLSYQSIMVKYMSSPEHKMFNRNLSRLLIVWRFKIFSTFITCHPSLKVAMS